VKDVKETIIKYIVEYAGNKKTLMSTSRGELELAQCGKKFGIRAE